MDLKKYKLLYTEFVRYNFKNVNTQKLTNKYDNELVDLDEFFYGDLLDGKASLVSTETIRKYSNGYTYKTFSTGSEDEEKYEKIKEKLNELFKLMINEWADENNIPIKFIHILLNEKEFTYYEIDELTKAFSDIESYLNLQLKNIKLSYNLVKENK